MVTLTQDRFISGEKLSKIKNLFYFYLMPSREGEFPHLFSCWIVKINSEIGVRFWLFAGRLNIARFVRVCDGKENGK